MAETTGGNSRPLPRPAWVWLILAWLVIAGSGGLYAFSRLPSLQQPLRFRDLASLERFIRLRFPAGSQLLYSHLMGGQDTAVVMKVALPPGSADEFVRQRSAAGSEDEDPLLSGKEEWLANPEWDPQKAHSFVNVNGRLWGQKVNGFGLIALDDPSRPVLYLYCER